VRLDEILKGQQAATRGELDDRLSLTSVLVDATMNPGLQGGTRQAQVQSRLADRVTRHRARVLPAVEVDHLAHTSKVPQRPTAFRVWTGRVPRIQVQAIAADHATAPAVACHAAAPSAMGRVRETGSRLHGGVVS
jgi:hypothetical protein